MADGARIQKPDNSADHAADAERPYYHFADIDTDVTRRILAFSDHGNFITVFAVFQIDIHQYGKSRNDEDRQYIFIAQLRQPCLFCQLIDDPYIYLIIVSMFITEVVHQSDGHIIHHQGKQSFVCIEKCLKNRGNYGPEYPH